MQCSYLLSNSFSKNERIQHTSFKLSQWRHMDKSFEYEVDRFMHCTLHGVLETVGGKDSYYRFQISPRTVF